LQDLEEIEKSEYNNLVIQVIPTCLVPIIF